MTTIAFDGTTLAADRCSWSGGIRRATRKVTKVRAPDGSRYLIAWTGSQAMATAVLAWMHGTGDRPNCKDFGSEPDGYCAVVIDQKMRVFVLSNCMTYIAFEERIFAGGAGAEFAFGALEAGATARRAIQIAMKRSDYAGLGVDVVRF